MDTFFMIFKKIVIGMVFVVFGMSMVYVPQHFGQVETVPEAYAAASGSVVYDPVNWVENAYTAVTTSAMQFLSSSLNIKEFTLDAIAWAIAKQIVSGMVASLVDWINSGFQGSPAFVQDLSGYLLQEADEAFGSFLNAVAPFICSPFQLDVQLAVAVSYDGSRVDDPPTCTLTGVFQNFESFIEGDFSQGGWDDWFKITSQPEVYTGYGSFLKIKGTGQARVINAKGEQLSILGFGGGFLSSEVCQDVAGAAGGGTECFISNPGKTISDSLSKALGAGQDTLVTADEISEIITALLSQLANSAITGAAGLLGLSGGTGYTYRGYSRGSFTEELINGTVTQTGGVNNSTTTPVGGGGTAPGDISFANGFIADALTEQQASLTRVRNYITELQAFVNNPLNTQQNIFIANVALNEALTYETNLEREITTVAPIVNEFVALEAEYVDATVERRIEIRSLQSNVVQEFNAVGLTNSATLESVFSRWDTILSENVVPGADSGLIDTDGDGLPDCTPTRFNPCILTN